MAEDSRRIVQLHKKDDKEDQWIPLTTGKCVQLTDYENTGETGDITNDDTLNDALSKLENRKADNGESLADYHIADAYTKDEVDALLAGIYHIQGGLDFANIHTVLTDSGTRIGDVYNLRDSGTMTADFIEYESQIPKTVAAGTNVVVVNDGTELNPVLKFDTLGMTASQSQTVNDGTLTIQQNNVTVNTFSANADTDVTINLTDTQYESKAESQNGTDVSLVTTGDKYKWNRKQDPLPDMTGKTGKCLKVVENSTTHDLELSWETDNDGGGTVTQIQAGAGLNTTSNDTSVDGGTPITGTGTIHLTKTAATPGSYGDSSAQTPSFGDSFNVPYITVDKYGRVTGISNTPVTLPSSPSGYTLPLAASGTRGGIQIGYSPASGSQNYAVQLDSEKAYVNVPWTDTHYTATPILGGTSSATANATSATANNSTYMNIVEDGSKSGGIQITGSGLVTVSANGGVLTVNATDPIPSQTNNSGKFLKTNGSSLLWDTPTDTNTFRPLKVNGTEKLSANVNTALDLVSGANVSLSESNGAVTISVPITDNRPTVSNYSASIAFKYGNNYFVGSATDNVQGVASGAEVTSLTITDGNGQNDSDDFEANVFFKAGASGTSMTVNIPQGYLIVGEEPEYVYGNIYIASLYKGTVVFGEIKQYEYIILTVIPETGSTDWEVLCDAVTQGDTKFDNNVKLAPEGFVPHPTMEHTFYYKYPKTRYLTDLSLLGYCGCYSRVELTESLGNVNYGFRAFQTIPNVVLPNATFNSSLIDEQLFNLGAVEELYVPTEPICDLVYLNLYEADALTVRSIENISYWLGNSGGDINLSPTAWARLSSAQQTTIQNRIEGKNWTIHFEHYVPE